ncbi:MAG: hypothetical protein R2852_01780 [Bacteroidia bacterium]
MADKSGAKVVLALEKEPITNRYYEPETERKDKDIGNTYNYYKYWSFLDHLVL